MVNHDIFGMGASFLLAGKEEVFCLAIRKVQVCGRISATKASTCALGANKCDTAAGSIGHKPSFL